MNFVQISDVHLDIPFKKISDRADFGMKRRLEQREAIRNVIDFIKDNKVEYLFICGDLYEDEYTKKSSIDYINTLFLQLPNVHIFITPGNHDPYKVNSYYRDYNWANNVKIFSSEPELIEMPDCDIYGFGFDNFEMNENQIEKINIKNKNKINILITHGEYKDNSKYNPMKESKLIEEGFDYIALGHIHKRDKYYSGSLISLGFDEPGEHGFYYVSIDNNKQKKTEFHKVDNREFIVKDLDISDISSEEELIEEINNIETEKNFYEINLVGYRNFEIDINLKLLNKNIIKLKNNTKIKIDMKQNNYTIKGIFLKKLNENLQKNLITKEEYDDIFELGINSLEK